MKINIYDVQAFYKYFLILLANKFSENINVIDPNAKPNIYNKDVSSK